MQLWRDSQPRCMSRNTNERLYGNRGDKYIREINRKICCRTEMNSQLRCSIFLKTVANNPHTSKHPWFFFFLISQTYFYGLFSSNFHTFYSWRSCLGAISANAAQFENNYFWVEKASYELDAVSSNSYCRLNPRTPLRYWFFFLYRVLKNNPHFHF